ncbi:MAG: radical SAM protein, partial [Oscillospiraceae bacterium]
ARRIPLTVELGLQTAHDRTAEALGRGHSFAEFCAGYALLRERGVRICVHLIDGLPGESADMMRETAREVAALSPDGIKLHMLHLLRGTALAARYAQTPFSLLTREQYVGIVCDQLELLPESCVIERLTGDGAAENLIAPDWTRNKRAVLNAIDAELLRRDSWQGKRIG